MITGLILAAGESTRMKSPKALLKQGESTFAEKIVQQMHSCGVDPIYIVAGAHFPEIQKQLGKREEFTVIQNLRYAHGQLSSLKEGLRQLPTGAEAVLVWPVDQPLVQPATVKIVVNAYRSSKKPVVIPVYEQKHGHPVLYGMPAIQAIFNLKKDQTAKDLQKIFDGETEYVQVNDPGVTIDIDTPEDYEKFISPQRH